MPIMAQTGGFTSGSTVKEENKTYWIKTGDDGSFDLMEGASLNMPLTNCVSIASLKESKTTNKFGEEIPVLRGTGFFKGKASNFVVRANTLEEKQGQVKKAEEARAKNGDNKPALLSNQPDLYVTIESYSLSGRVEKPAAPAASPTDGTEDMPF